MDEPTTPEDIINPSSEPHLTQGEKALFVTMMAEEVGELTRALRKGMPADEVDALFDLIGNATALLGSLDPAVVQQAYTTFAAARAEKNHPPGHWHPVLEALAKRYGAPMTEDRLTQARGVVAHRYP